jgi:hypothetical protein
VLPALSARLSDAAARGRTVAEACVGTHGVAYAEESDSERQFRGTRPICTRLILAHLAEHGLGLPRRH